MTIPKPIADQLRDHIAKSGMSAREIARIADVAHTIVAKFIKGGDIRISSAEAIALAIGKPLRM